MSKSRVPQLPVSATRTSGRTYSRADGKVYVEEVRRYAQTQFKLGLSEAEVCNLLLTEGKAPATIKFVISHEYLAYLGVTEGAKKTVKFFATLCALVFYGAVTYRNGSESTMVRFVIPVFLAVLLSFAFEALGIRFLKWRKQTLNRA